MIRVLFSLCLLVVITLPLPAASQQSSLSQGINTAQFDAEVMAFLQQEMAAHLSDIKSYDPAPGKVFGAGTTGEYTWGTFMNAVGAYAESSGNRMLAGRGLAHEVGQIGL